MIVSKSGLLVVELTKADNKVPVLDNVHIEKDGTCVGSSGKSVLLVSPVLPETKKSLKNILQESGNDEMTISADTIKTVLKNLPPDKQFGGILEHCNIDKRGNECKIQTTDGKRRRSIIGKLYNRGYLPFKKMVGLALSSSERKSGKRIVLNLKRLILLLSSIEKICPDTTNESPVWIDFTDDGQIVIRAINNTNGQRCIGIMTSYKGIEGQWLEADDWEQSFIEEKPEIKRKRRFKAKKVLQKHKK